MSTVQSVPQVPVSLHAGSLVECEADALVLPVFEQDALSDFETADGAVLADLRAAIQRGEFRAKPFELHIVPFSERTRRLVCVGAGPLAAFTLERVRRAATAGALAARQRGAGRVALLLRTTGRDAELDARAATDGLVLAALGPDRYKTKPPDAVPLTAVTIVAPGRASLARAVNRGAINGHCTNAARALSDEPGNTMTPVRLAEEAKELLAGTSVACEVLDETRLAELRMGLMLGVARGSVEPPRLIVMRYAPPSGATDRTLALVGKGVTFDTGGISIKPADGMEKMKHDMSGGAAVIGAMRAIAELQPAIPVLGIVPAVENMPGGRAIKPGDILTSAAGKTVEVINTDAEGRLILGDALWYATTQGATHLVDVATLTGACVIALGKVNSGLFGTPDEWVAQVRDAATRVGERVWQLPADDDYAELLKSDSADIANSGGRAGGAISAAMFLREFIADRPWAHLDIAGTAWADDSKPWQPKGATGVTVRTLVELAMSMGSSI